MKIFNFKNFKKASGFTLLEVLLTVALVALLMLTSVYLFEGYRGKVAFGELKQLGDHHKSFVAACMQVQGNALTDCDEDTNGIPADVTANAGTNADKVAIINGIITITPAAINGLVTGDVVVLTPTLVSPTTAGTNTPSNVLTWAATGQGCTKFGC